MLSEKNNAPNLTTQPTWKVKKYLGAPHVGKYYVQEKLTVQNIVLSNIADGSNAFMYVKAHIRNDNGRVYVKDICDWYKNESM